MCFKISIRYLNEDKFTSYHDQAVNGHEAMLKAEAGLKREDPHEIRVQKTNMSWEEWTAGTGDLV